MSYYQPIPGNMETTMPFAIVLRHSNYHYNNLPNYAATDRSASPLAGEDHTSPIFTEAPQGQGHGIDPGEVLL